MLLNSWLTHGHNHLPDILLPALGHADHRPRRCCGPGYSAHIGVTNYLLGLVGIAGPAWLQSSYWAVPQ